MVALFAALMLGSPTVVATINTGLRPCGSAAHGKYLYVDNYGAGTISRIDPATNNVTTVTVGHFSELCVDPHADGVWVSDEAGNTVTRIDPATNAVVAVIPVGTGPADGARGPDGREWIPNGDGTISVIDPTTN